LIDFDAVVLLETSLINYLTTGISFDRVIVALRIAPKSPVGLFRLLLSKTLMFTGSRRSTGFLLSTNGCTLRARELSFTSWRSYASDL
jgi:hypothetical protein